MQIYVACDICGHRHVLSEEKLGRTSKCKMCGVTYQVNEENLFDPEEPEEKREDDDKGPRFALIPSVVHSVCGVLTLLLIVWMMSHLFTTPRLSAQLLARKLSANRSDALRESPASNSDASAMPPASPAGDTKPECMSVEVPSDHSEAGIPKSDIPDSNIKTPDSDRTNVDGTLK